MLNFVKLLLLRSIYLQIYMNFYKYTLMSFRQMSIKIVILLHFHYMTAIVYYFIKINSFSGSLKGLNELLLTYFECLDRPY